MAAARDAGEVVLDPAAGVGAGGGAHGHRAVTVGHGFDQPGCGVGRRRGAVGGDGDGCGRGGGEQGGHLGGTQGLVVNPEIIEAALEIVAGVAAAQIVGIFHQRRVEAVRQQRHCRIARHQHPVEVKRAGAAREHHRDMLPSVGRNHRPVQRLGGGAVADDEAQGTAGGGVGC